MASDENLQSKATDFVKKVLTVGMGTLFLTEESLKGLVSEFKLPKELLGGILESANKTRREFLGNLSQELITRVSEKVDARELVKEVLDRNEIEISMKISFKPKE
ncbi:hypothetical protein EBZ37_06640 [bacterium]|nr:hypothetical protein [bacterium]